MARDARPFIPLTSSLNRLRKSVQGCRGCELYKYATQAVFGEGDKNAPVVLVGEAPGDHEDREGRPFVGPSGHLLDQALQSAKIPREEIYITNAVKHFKYVQRGKRRLHQKPNGAEIHACLPWLQEEVGKIKPRVLVCLGATAARAVFGKAVTLRSLRGSFHRTPMCDQTLVTVHPSAILRADPRDHAQALKEFFNDFKMVRRKLGL